MDDAHTDTDTDTDTHTQTQTQTQTQTHTDTHAHTHTQRHTHTLRMPTGLGIGTQVSDIYVCIATPSVQLCHFPPRTWSICVRGWRVGRPIPWLCSSIHCFSPTATSGWTMRLHCRGDTSQSVLLPTWCWGGVRQEGRGM